MKKLSLILAVLLAHPLSGEINSGTILVMNQTQFSEERYVFTSKTEGVYQDFRVEYCKESEENPYGIMYTKQKEEPFVYDAETGRVSIQNDDDCRVLVHLEEKTWFMYDDSVVFVRAAVKARKLWSAWGEKKFSKPLFLFFSDGTCKIRDWDCTYRCQNGISCVSAPNVPRFLYFFQNGNALYTGVGYLTEESSE